MIAAEAGPSEGRHWLYHALHVAVTVGTTRNFKIILFSMHVFSNIILVMRLMEASLRIKLSM